MALKQRLLTLARSAGLFAAARHATGSRLRILAYHGLWITPGFQFGDTLFMGPDQFEARMARLKRSGLPVLPLGEAIERLSERTLPDAAVAITIDDGWSSTFSHMLPVLEAFELPATLYATTWYSGRDLPVVNIAAAYLIAAAGRSDLDVQATAAAIDALPIGERLDALRALGRKLGIDEAWLELRQFHLMSAGELAEAHRRGLDVQLHTHRHIDLETEIDALPDEIVANRDFLAAAIPGGRFDHFCYPSGSTHPRAPALLAASGIRSATLDVEGLNPPSADPFALRRLLDGRTISDVEFDAYLAGALHYAGSVRKLLSLNAPA
ncbi:MAG TPA: polysaccharide deacetylase family protein [Allosphingosinicella sp.]|nr:polysaccharide deacetylase family protein [Allosphingosinicella sp.]